MREVKIIGQDGLTFNERVCKKHIEKLISEGKIVIISEKEKKRRKISKIKNDGSNYTKPKKKR